jgi:hypothetical protein
MTKDELYKALREAHKKFFSRPKIIFKLIIYLKFGQLKFLFRRFLDYNILGHK